MDGEDGANQGLEKATCSQAFKKSTTSNIFLI
jgi:hypothetical protein